jgi:hypothetical protein
MNQHPSASLPLLRVSASLPLLLPLAFALSGLACTSSSGGKGHAGATGSAGTTATAGTTGAAGNTPTAGTTGGGGATPTAGTTGGGGATPTAGTTGGGGATPTGGTGGTTTPTGGMTGMAGSMGTGGAVDTDQSVLERNKHPSRDGFFIQPMLTKTNIAKMALDANFKPTFASKMWASPLYVKNGPGGKGVFFAVNTNNDVFAFDETSGAIVWQHSIGMASPGTGAGCGEGPIGISGTPVIDGTTRTIYVAGGVGNNVMRHEVHALSIDDGMERAGWPVSLGGKTSGGNTFNPSQHNQRGSLSLVNGVVYVPYGGYNGDCGGYHGWVFAIDTKNPTNIGAWATAGQGEAIWASGGMASDGTAIFATTGNSTNGAATHQDSEEIVRLTGMATFDKATGAFWPTDWRNMDGGDADLGASSPVYFEVPGSTPSTLVAAVAKNGSFYIVNSKNLGGMGGSVVGYKATNSAGNGGDSVRTAMASYTTTKGRYVVFNGGNPICPKGTGPMISISVAAGAPPKATTAWCSGPGTNTSPIITSPDGTNDVVVWYLAGGKLYGVDGDTGASVYTSTESCPNGRRWTSPIAANGRIVVGTDDRLCSWSPH